jgi:hypothetical protein
MSRNPFEKMKYLITVFLSIALLGCDRTSWRNPDERVFADLNMMVMSIAEISERDGHEIDLSVESLQKLFRHNDLGNTYVNFFQLNDAKVIAGFSILRKSEGVAFVVRTSERDTTYRVISLRDFASMLQTKTINPNVGREFTFAD